MRHLLIILFVCLFGLDAAADTFTYLNFVSGSSTTQVSTDGLKITFTDGNLVANVGGSVQTLPLSSLSEMYFTDTALSTTIKGDLNHDGLIDLTDLNMLINKLLSGTYDDAADMNNDNDLDVSDIALIIDIIIN